MTRRLVIRVTDPPAIPAGCDHGLPPLPMEIDGRGRYPRALTDYETALSWWTSPMGNWHALCVWLSERQLARWMRASPCSYCTARAGESCRTFKAGVPGLDVGYAHLPRRREFRRRADAIPKDVFPAWVWWAAWHGYNGPLGEDPDAFDACMLAAGP